jgi:hypothetical protein
MAYKRRHKKSKQKSTVNLHVSTTNRPLLRKCLSVCKSPIPNPQSPIPSVGLVRLGAYERRRSHRGLVKVEDQKRAGIACQVVGPTNIAVHFQRDRQWLVKQCSKILMPICKIALRLQIGVCITASLRKKITEEKSLFGIAQWTLALFLIS